MRINLVICILVLFIARVNAISLEEAQNAFSKTSESTSDIWQGDDYLFARLKLNFDPEDTPEEREEQLMEKQLDILGNYITEEANKIRYTNTPFSQKMAKFLLGEMPFKFSNIACVTVKESMEGKYKIQILAFSKNELDKIKNDYNKQAESIKNMSEAEWGNLLAKSFSSLKTNEEKQTFIYMLGGALLNSLIEGNIRYGKGFDELSEKGIGEFLAMINWPQSEFYYSDKSFIWGYVWGTKGNLRINQAKPVSDEKFSEAKYLYGKGQNIERIVDLLRQSIETNPADAEKWRYLGGVLKVKKMYREALVAYMQAYRLQPNEKTLNEIGKLCMQCDMPANAEGIKWYLAMLKK